MPVQTDQGPHLLIRAPQERRSFNLGNDPVTIGRHSENKLRHTEPLASRFHCVIEKVREGYRLRDLDSRNGTKINGHAVKLALLLPDDVVQIGQTLLKLVIPRNTDAPEADDASELADSEVDPDAIVAAEEEANRPMPDYIRQLAKMADSLPDKRFRGGDITLLNARGKVAHAAGEAKRGAAGGEPIDVMRLLLLICFRIRASDIHVEPKNEDYALRIRVDGNMVDVVRLSSEMGVRLTSLVKILCDIDISQRNIVQEGHFSSKVADRRVDYRVSFAPAMFGQKLVIRILDTANMPLHVKNLELPEWMFKSLTNGIQQESGMILVCGPTGSGKTTTLYALVRDLDVSQRNVVTIEDPVEIQIEGVTQIPVNEAQGNSFSSLLRSVLRQDPDAILVGEIRDPETARIAMQAAMTGHLVFSTVHAKDTIGTIFRLLDLGVEPFLVASGLQTVLAQRLVRQLCPYCKKPTLPTTEQLERMGDAAQGVGKIFEPVGCQRCLNTGFAGRRAIFELLTSNEKLRDVLQKGATAQEIQQALADTPFARLARTGYQLVADGITAFDEVDRAVG